MVKQLEKAFKIIEDDEQLKSVGSRYNFSNPIQEVLNYTHFVAPKQGVFRLDGLQNLLQNLSTQLNISIEDEYSINSDNVIAIGSLQPIKTPIDSNQNDLVKLLNSTQVQEAKPKYSADTQIILVPSIQYAQDILRDELDTIYKYMCDEKTFRKYQTQSLFGKGSTRQTL